MSKDDRELIADLRAMTDSGGKAIVCRDRTTREMCDDILLAATRLEALQAQPVGEEVIEVVTKAIMFADSGSTEGWEDNVSLGKAAIEAMPQEGWAVAALRDVVDPLAKLGRDAKAQGRTLSGEAYRIAHDVSFIKSIAKDALAALTASPPVVEREDDAAQRLQDHMEQHHGVCLPASAWDDAILALTPVEGVGETLVEACKPWADYHGDLPDYDHPLRCVFESGVQYAVELLAKELEVKHWEVCDGTEEFDGDLGGTLMNIVREAMPKDADGEQMWPSEVREALSTPVAQGDEVREALEEIAAERERQISAEGWTPEHDDEHHDGSLAKAAACYARDSRQYWPWDRMWWKPRGKRANLVRAGALIVAEIERLDRATDAAPSAAAT